MARTAWHTGPIPSLENAILEKDWFKGIVLSATWLERHGCQMLKECFASKEDKVDRELERLSLREIALFLYGFDNIHKVDYNTIIKINRERNKAVHQKKARAFFVTRESEKKYEPLIREIIRILVEKFNVVRLFISR